MEPGGFEPPSPSLQRRCATRCATAPADGRGWGLFPPSHGEGRPWWAMEDSNLRPRSYQDRALAT